MAASNLPGSWRYLQDASPQMLQAFELSRLNLAANLRKQLEVLVSQYLEEALAAMFARSLLNRLSPARVSTAGDPSLLPAAPPSLSLPLPAQIPSKTSPPVLVLDQHRTPNRRRLA